MLIEQILSIKHFCCHLHCHSQLHIATATSANVWTPCHEQLTKNFMLQKSSALGSAWGGSLLLFSFCALTQACQMLATDRDQG
jgi:hypothetical protein